MIVVQKVIGHWRTTRQREFLCRWLLVGRLAFGQFGARMEVDDIPTIAWVQMLPETPADWHPLEHIDGGRVLTIDHSLDDRSADGPGRCPN